MHLYYVTSQQLLVTLMIYGIITNYGFAMIDGDFPNCKFRITITYFSCILKTAKNANKKLIKKLT